MVVASMVTTPGLYGSLDRRLRPATVSRPPVYRSLPMDRRGTCFPGSSVGCCPRGRLHRQQR